jgi:hypothetical protein
MRAFARTVASRRIIDAAAPYRPAKPNQDQRFEMSAAARQRLHRHREAKGRIVLQIETDTASRAQRLVVS